MQSATRIVYDSIPFSPWFGLEWFMVITATFCLLSLLSIFTGIMGDYDYHSGTLHDLQELGQWNEPWSFNTNTNRCFRNARTHRHRFFSAGTSQLVAITVARLRGIEGY